MMIDVCKYRISDVPEVFYSGEQYGVSAVQYDDEIGMQVVHSYEVICSSKKQQTLNNSVQRIKLILSKLLLCIR